MLKQSNDELIEIVEVADKIAENLSRRKIDFYFVKETS